MQSDILIWQVPLSMCREGMSPGHITGYFFNSSITRYNGLGVDDSVIIIYICLPLPVQPLPGPFYDVSLPAFLVIPLFLDQWGHSSAA